MKSVKPSSPQTHSPMVSVIVPAYNHAPYLRERIDSILNQTFQDFELILLDDCSPDDSARILRSYEDNPRVKGVIVNDKNSGSTFAQWKKGLSIAEGKYVWIAESDDSSSLDFLSEMVEKLEENPEAQMAFCGSRMIDAEGMEIQEMDWDRWKEGDPETEVREARSLIASHLLFTSNIYNAGQVLMRRDALPEITEEQTRMHYCGDWLFWVNLLAGARKGIIVRKKLNSFRQHDRKVSPGASKSGLYFIEGLPIMAKVADILGLNEYQRKVLAGRTLKRLRKFPHLAKEKRDLLNSLLDALSKGTAVDSLMPIYLYQIDKNLTHKSGLVFTSLR